MSTNFPRHSDTSCYPYMGIQTNWGSNVLPWLIGSSSSAASNFCQFLKFWKLKLGKDCKYLWHNSYQPREKFEIHGYIMLLEIEKAAIHFCCRGWILHIPHMKYLTQELCFGLFNFFTSCMKVTQEKLLSSLNLILTRTLISSWYCNTPYCLITLLNSACISTLFATAIHCG